MENTRVLSGRLWRLCWVVALFFVLAANSAVWAKTEAQSGASVSAGESAKSAPQFSVPRSKRVMLFLPGSGEWAISRFEQAKPGDEFYFNGQLFRVVDSDKAQFVLNVDARMLFEADVQSGKSSHKPESTDVVQVLDKDNEFAAHALLNAVQPGSIIRFQGKSYSVKADHGLADTGKIFSSKSLQRIEITNSAWQHVTEGHTVGGAKNAGKSIFYPAEDIRTLIYNAQFVSPVLEANGYLKRDFDAGRAVGTVGKNGTPTTTYRVITTQAGKLVTVYPVIP